MENGPVIFSWGQLVAPAQVAKSKCVENHLTKKKKNDVVFDQTQFGGGG